MEYAFTLFDGDVTNGEETSATISRLGDVEVGQYVKVTVTVNDEEHEYLAKIFADGEGSTLPFAELWDDEGESALHVGLYNVSGVDYTADFLSTSVNAMVDYAESFSTIHIKAEIYNSTGISYDTPGEYELIYTATDACGNETTETRQITVVEKKAEG